MDVPLDVSAYLRRVDLRAPPPPTFDGLKALHSAQIRKIPFENFDIHMGRGIDPTRPAIYEKTLGKRRGGYCFELNELLYAALEAFGFETRREIARVHISGQPSPHTHQFSIAAINGQEYLVDAGFGGQSPRGPIPLVFDAVTEIDFKRYRLIAAPPFGTMLQDMWQGAWRNLYSFDGRMVLHADRYLGNHFTSTSPFAFFTWAMTASIHTATARFSLFDTVLTQETASGAADTNILAGDPFLEILETVFGIELDVPFAELKPLNLPPKRG